VLIQGLFKGQTEKAGSRFDDAVAKIKFQNSCELY